MHTGEGDLKSAIFTHFRPLWPWAWIGSYGIPSCITHRPLPILSTSAYIPNFIQTGKTFCGRTDGQWEYL